MLLKVVYLTLLIGIAIPTLAEFTCTFVDTAGILLSTEITNPDQKATFDNQGFSSVNPWTYNLADPLYEVVNDQDEPIGLFIGGSSAKITRTTVTLTPAIWNGLLNWPDLATKPFYFVALTSPTADQGTLVFDPPIYDVSMRIGVDNRAPCAMFLTDDSDGTFSCAMVPNNTDGFTNEFHVVRVQTYERKIQRISFFCHGIAIDDIAFKQCANGFKLANGVCSEINECQENPDICSGIPNTQCFNLRGSYDCPCKTGYHSDVLEGCIDNDECQEGTPCSEYAVCNNTAGSYICTCNEGFKGNGNGVFGCDDINECNEGNPCDPLAVSCDNSVGSYTCTCPSGYSGDGKGPNGCHDINECDDLSVCSPDATCTNTNGSFVCTCNSGYDGDGIGIDGCSDINECNLTESLCHPLSTCKNQVGSFCCTSCPDGYTGDGYGKEGCQDINECSEQNNPCNEAAVCENTAGSFNCTCFFGFSGTGVGVDGCSDIDECESNPCDANAVCNNTPGSYSCNCNDGYEGDGFDCVKSATPVSTPIALGSTPVAAPVDVPVGRRPVSQNSSSKIGLNVVSALIMICVVFLVY